MAIDVLLGLQWGDEGKGKIVDVLGKEYDIIARFQGGPNAGHTLVVEGKKYILHQIPSGIFHSQVTCLIGNGVVINPVILKQELDTLAEVGVDVAHNLCLSRRIHLILPTHRLIDKASELKKGDQKIGSTLRGIGPTYMDKMARQGIRIGDLTSANFSEHYRSLKEQHLALLHGYYGFTPDQYLSDLTEWEALFWESLPAIKALKTVDSEYYLNEALDEGKKILAEGAQGTLLDIDFGSYPFVTSSNTTTGGASNGLGIAPSRFDHVYGVFKAYCTRVGSGPFPTELHGTEADELRTAGGEFGSTTGRARRVGWLDLPALKYACMLNGTTQLVMTKADVLTGRSSLQVCTAYDSGTGPTDKMPYRLEPTLRPIYQTLPCWPVAQLPTGQLHPHLEAYLQLIEGYLGLPVYYISLGADRKDIVLRHGQPNPA